MVFSSSGVFGVLQFSGLLPLKLQRENCKPIQVKVSKMLLALSSAIFLINVVLGGISCHTAFNNILKPTKEKPLDHMIRTAYLATRCISHIGAVVLQLLAIIKTEKKERFLKSLSEFYFEINVNQETRTSHNVYYALLVLRYARSIYITFKSKLETWNIFAYHSEIIETLLICVIVEICEVVNVMNNSLLKINDDTTKLLKEDLSMRSTTSSNIEGVYSRVYNAQPNILSLCKTHTGLCSLLKQMRNVYQHQLLVIFCIIFLNITFLPICLTDVCLTPEFDPSDRIWHIFWFLLLVSCVVHLVMLCSCTKTQAEDVKSKVASLMAKSQNPKTMKYLKFFLAQLSIQKGEFSVCGMFVIKPSMMLTIVNVLLSYYLLLWSVWN